MFIFCRVVTSLSLSLSLADSEKASCHVVSCSMERDTYKGTEVDSMQETEPLSPTTCKKLDAVNSHVSLEVDPSLVKPQTRPQP